MALSQVDRIKITGIITKKQILEFNDIIVDSKGGGTVDDYLDFAINAFENKLESKSKDKILLKFLNAIEVIVAEYIYKEYSIPEDLSKRLVGLKDKYLKYLETNGIESDEGILAKLNEIEDDLIDHTLTISSPEEAESNIVDFNQGVKGERIIPESDLIKDLAIAQMRNEELEKNLKQTKKEITSYKRKLTNKDKVLDKQTEAFKVTTSKLLEATKNSKTLESENKKLQSEVNSLKEEYQESEKNNQKNLEELKRKSEENESLSNRLNELNKEEKNKELNRVLDDTILGILVKAPHTIDEIGVELSLKKIHVSDNEILESIKRLNKLVNINANNIRNFKPLYEICSPLIRKDKTINLDVNVNSCLDVLLISDLHITRYDESLKKLYDMVNEYAINNNIKFIFDLGDLFDFSYSLNHIKEKDERLKKMYEIILNTSNSLEECNGVNRAILGGNHDTNIVHKGIDPIELFISNRTDSINLGYNLAQLRLGNNSILLHHPNNIRFKSFPDDDNETAYDIVEYIARCASRLGIRVDDAYMNIFGHFHKNCVDSTGNVSVPSLTKDRVGHGAMHLKIYFDESKNITNVVIINAIKVNDKLVKSSEVMYKKRTLEK